MSREDNPLVAQEPNELPRAHVNAFWIGLGILLAAGWFLTWVAYRGVPLDVGPRREAAAVEHLPREIDMIDQSLFEAHEPSRGNWDAKERALESYAWVDRPSGVVHIPIERAMDILTGEGHVR